MSQISGNFKALDSNLTYYITINIYDSINNNYTIQDTVTMTGTNNDPHIFFAPDPIVVKRDYSDPFTHVKISTATITLISNINLVETFAMHNTTENKADVNIYLKNGSSYEYLSVFRGFIESDVFKQDYAYNYSTFTLNATDQYSFFKYKYNFVKYFTEEEGLCPIMKIPISAFESHGNYQNDYLNDANSNYTPYNMYNTIMGTNLLVNPDVFGARSIVQDDWMTDYEILEEYCKYMNIYITNIYMRMGGLQHLYYCAWPADYGYKAIAGHFTKDDAGSNDTSISNSECYNVIRLTCEIEPVEKLLDFGDDVNTDTGLYSPYRNKQKYMTEIFSCGEGKDASNAFYDMVVENKSTTYDSAYTIDNYVYILKSDAWDFSRGYTDNQRELYDYTTQIEMGNDNWGRNQHKILKWMANSNYIRPAWVAFGRSRKLDLKDDSPVASIKTTKYLYIPIWGTEYHYAQSSLQNKFNDYTAEHPLASYTPYQNITLTPASANVTNYIIISGKILLNPLQQVTGTNWSTGEGFTVMFPTMDTDESVQRIYPRLWYVRSTNVFDDTYNLMVNASDSNHRTYRTVPHPDNGDGAYYTQKFWSCSDIKEDDYTAVTNEKWAYGFLDNSSNKQLEYSYAARDDGDGGEDIDKISKIALLKCELKVGDKYCCEFEDDEDHFEWLTAEEAQTRGVDPVIYLGINPKLGDFIIGTSFPITNTISDIMNLDGEGMAIPIKSTDNVSGAFSFKIIGPMNPVWQDLEYIHATFWRHSRWNTFYRYLMEKTQAIMIENLEIEVQNDNALANVDMTTSDNDLVYASDMNPAYSEIKDIDLKICSGLSSDECHEYAIANDSSKTFVVDNTTNAPYLGEVDQSIQDGEFYIKQEQKIVDSLYKECCKPKTVIHTTLKRSNKLNEINFFKHINDLWYVDWWSDSRPVKLINAEFDLKYGMIECDFKEFDTSLINT